MQLSQVTWNDVKDIPMGEYDRRRKLTDEQKKQICKLRKKGWLIRELCDFFRVSRGTISRVLHPDEYRFYDKLTYLCHLSKGIDYDKAMESLENTKVYKMQLYLEGKIG